MADRRIAVSFSLFYSHNCERYSSFLVFFNWDLLHASLNSQYEVWSYKEKKHKNIKAYRKFVKKGLQLNGVC